MKQEVLWVIGAVALVGLGALFYYQRQQEAMEQQPEAEVAAPAAADTGEKIQNPVPDAPQSDVPLPAINESDKPARDSLAGVFGADAIAEYLVPDEVIRHFVVTVDNLPRRKLALNMRPVKPVPGNFVVTGEGDTLTLGAANFERYAPLVKVVGAADAKQVAALYVRFYPLLQQSFENLGYPSAYFNDRAVAVIDHLLETPDIKGPIKLVQPRVYYEFADPALEARSSGQKLLIRMGSENAAVIKAKLREIRAELAAKPPAP